MVAWYIVLQLRLRWACLTPLKQSLIASLPGGILPTHPPEWGEEEITNWISQRGFARATGCRRQGRRPGFFRAHSPTDAENTNVAFVFKSGISMAPARAVGTKNYSAITQPKASWGSPALKIKANAIDLEDSDTENPKDTVAPTALDESEADNMQVDNEEKKGKPVDAGSSANQNKNFHPGRTFGLPH